MLRLIDRLNLPRAGKRQLFSPPHEREAEPCFWSRAENTERIYKKSHATKLSNDNHANFIIVRRGLPAIVAVSL
jgi:hypothetical protein